MSDRPRRRSTQRPRAPEPKYPLLPIVLAVALAGFVIGAAFAFYQRSQAGVPLPLATPSLPPAIEATPLPSARAVPSVARSPAPSPTPSPTPVPSASPAPSATPSVAPSQSPTPSASPSPAASASVAPSDDADSTFARLAAVVVRQYLAALQRGDEPAAYAAFGAVPGATGISFVEKRYVDRTTRIVRVSSSGTDDEATVDVDLETGGTTYFAQYVLTRAPSGAAVIERHTIAKP